MNLPMCPKGYVIGKSLKGRIVFRKYNTGFSIIFREPIEFEILCVKEYGKEKSNG